ncbi:MAG: hypothetical protein QM772_06510 [Ottowia sp.]|uniref:hypothetical protein n=1 Tax=Ottowia sp. TaxID=1898956 RepID=UPI0039E64E38
MDSLEMMDGQGRADDSSEAAAAHARLCRQIEAELVDQYKRLRVLFETCTEAAQRRAQTGGVNADKALAHLASAAVAAQGAAARTLSGILRISSEAQLAERAALHGAAAPLVEVGAEGAQGA